MVSELASRVGRIIPFINPVQEENMDNGLELLGAVIGKLYELTLDAAEFISSYVQRSAFSTSSPFEAIIR